MPNLVIINPFTGRIQTTKGSVRFTPTRDPTVKRAATGGVIIDPQAATRTEAEKVFQKQRDIILGSVTFDKRLKPRQKSAGRIIREARAKARQTGQNELTLIRQMTEKAFTTKAGKKPLVILTRNGKVKRVSPFSEKARVFPGSKVSKTVKQVQPTLDFQRRVNLFNKEVDKITGNETAGQLTRKSRTLSDKLRLNQQDLLRELSQKSVELKAKKKRESLGWPKRLALGFVQFPREILKGPDPTLDSIVSSPKTIVNDV